MNGVGGWDRLRENGCHLVLLSDTSHKSSLWVILPFMGSSHFLCFTKEEKSGIHMLHQQRLMQ